MSMNSVVASQQDRSVATEPRPIRPWLLPGLTLVCGYWAYFVAMNMIELPISTKFFASLAGALLFPLAFTIWWFASRGVSLRDRFLIYGAMVVLGILAGVLMDPSIRVFAMMLFAPSAVLTAWAVWLTVSRRASRRVQLWGLMAVFSLVWGAFLLARMDGVTGDQMAGLHWRWTPTAEELFLAEQSQPSVITGSQARTDAKKGDLPLLGAGTMGLMASPLGHGPFLATSALFPTQANKLTQGAGDWSQFRGPDRLGELRGVRIVTDWNANSPKFLWKRRVGPAWSSVTIIGDRLYTQEQRGDIEAVICLDTATGRERWMHGDKTRFWDNASGAGPRSTPTFDDGCIYTLGGTGRLNCLDAVTGKLNWTRDIRQESGAKPQMWGYANSPLIVDGLVIVWAGGKEGQGLLAYKKADGQPAWHAPAGTDSYSSPQLATFDGQKQVLIFSDQGLAAFDPVSGAPLWDYPAPAHVWRAIQPRPLKDGVLFGSEDLGLILLDIRRDGGKWKASERWKSQAMRPGFNDLVISDGLIFGLVNGVCTCVDLKNGQRLWKGDRYGHGQLLLLADQKLLMVLSEQGEAALVRVSAENHEEIARFQAIKEKTWNHPVIAHGRLFTRNDVWMACFELQIEPGSGASKK